jgi:outer membrane biosynthesis protein TonB
MKRLATLVSLLVLVVFAVSVCSAAPPAVSDTTKKMVTKHVKATTEKAKSKTAPATTHVKSYTTKSGKVVKGYERKTTTKVKEPTKVTKPAEKMAKPTTKATTRAKVAPKTAVKGAKGGMGPAPGMVHVKGYCKKNGVCVKDYWRHAPSQK